MDAELIESAPHLLRCWDSWFEGSWSETEWGQRGLSDRSHHRIEQKYQREPIKGSSMGAFKIGSFGRTNRSLQSVMS